MEHINRQYRILQRRTILYGLAAMGLAALLSVWVVLSTGMSAWLALPCGMAFGITFQLVSAYIARRMTRD